jgi:hypothetical protein
MFAKFEIDKNCGGNRYAGNPDIRFFFPSDATRPSRKGCKNSILYISHDVAKSLRWILGDRVDFYWDANSKKVGVKRSTSGIAAVCQSKGKGRTGQHHVHVNRQVAETIARAWGGDRSDGYSVIAKHEIVDDMLVLSFEKIS